jgi:proline iminopeptidase
VAADVEFRAPTAGGDLVGWRRDGPSGRPPALLLHGGPGLSEYLSSLADELDGLVATARYQQRGLAPSLTGGPFSVEQHVADAVAVLDALGWQRPMVIGHSWGGHLALHLALARPDRVGALVILDALGAVGDGGEAVFVSNLRSGLSAEQLHRMAEIEALEAPSAAELREHLGIVWPNYFGDPPRAPRMPDLDFAASSEETWASIHAHLATGTLEHGLPGVEVPALVVHGDRSPIPLAEGERIAALMPHGQLTVQAGKGHWAWLEQPGFVRAEVARFMSR